MVRPKYDEEGSSWSMQDPAKVIELRQLKSCKGCAHERVAFGTTRYCEKQQPHGKRCKQYYPLVGDRLLEKTD